MNTIGIIGRGFVGTAVFEGMKHAFDVFSWDKAKGWKAHEQYVGPPKADDMLSDEEIKLKLENGEFDKAVEQRKMTPLELLVELTDGPIFVCVPTPMKKNSSCDTSIVEGVIKELNEICAKLETERIVVIKSTVPPGTTDRLDRSHQHLHICFNPEFLTERNFIEDFKNQDRIIIGGTREATNVVKQLYQMAYPDVSVTKTSDTIAELVKYITNCFLATKVSFANEMKQICDKLEIDYDKVVEYATKDKRLGTSHWAVPGPMPASDGSGKLLPGFSGSCLIKDLNALIAVATELEINPIVMKATWEKNLTVRPERDWEQLIGRAVAERKENE